LVDDIVNFKTSIEVNEKNGEDTSKQAAELNEKKKLQKHKSSEINKAEIRLKRLIFLRCFTFSILLF
jgi:hypothetical protein